MTKNFCDNCNGEANEPDFHFEATVVKVSQLSTIVGAGAQLHPQVTKKNLHLCKKCYDEKLGL